MASTSSSRSGTATARNRLDDDPFLDDDLLDFEDPSRREMVAAKMRRVRVPGTITAARTVMYVQLVAPFILQIVLVATRGGRGRAARAAATTTTTVASTATVAARQGRGGAFLIFFLGVIIFFVGLLVIAAKLGKASAPARYAAFILEALILLLSVRGLTAGRAGSVMVSAILGGFALTVVVLLLTPSANKAFSRATVVGDISARFDVRSLERLDS